MCEQCKSRLARQRLCVFTGMRVTICHNSVVATRLFVQRNAISEFIGSNAVKSCLSRQGLAPVRPDHPLSADTSNVILRGGERLSVAGGVMRNLHLAGWTGIRIVLPRIFLVVLCAAILACNHSEESSQDSAPTLLSSSPAEFTFAAAEGLPVSVLFQPAVTLDVDIDPASLATASITLQMTYCIPDQGCGRKLDMHGRQSRGQCAMCHSVYDAASPEGSTKEHLRIEMFFVDRTSDPVDGTAQWDASTRTLTFSPARPLARGASYTLMMSGIRDLNGATLTDMTVSFDTVSNPVAVETTYLESGEVEFYMANDLDPRGRVLRSRKYTSAGPDGVWHTDDDVLGLYVANQYDSNDLLSEQTIIGGPGPDNVWLNEDDLIATLYRYETDQRHLTRLVIVTAAGGDGLWRTDDDLVERYWAFRYNTQGTLVRLGQYSGAGPDGMFFTVDDIAASNSIVWQADTDATGRDARITAYYDSGVDGIWETPDDTVAWRDDIIQNAADFTSTTVRYIPGNDGKWFTDDDVVANYVMEKYDASGRLLNSDYAVSPGADGVWFTGDDAFNSKFRQSYADDGSLVQADFLYSSRDTGWAQFDLMYYDQYDYNADAQLTRSSRFNGSGPDNTWYTSDDVLQSLTMSEYDTNGNRLSTTSIRGAGVDGQWNTPDDVHLRDLIFATDR